VQFYFALVKRDLRMVRVSLQAVTPPGRHFHPDTFCGQRQQVPPGRQGKGLASARLGGFR
jgi:hypothetical protein